MSVKALSIQVEMDVNERPPEGTLGGRVVAFTEDANFRNISGIFSDEVDGLASDGHINRNIRLITQFL